MDQQRDPRHHETDMEVVSGNTILHGIIGRPENARGVVLFAHGSGSGRLSPRNNYVARVLQGGGFATLLIDLLTNREASDTRYVFDIDLLAWRLRGATSWLRSYPETQNLPIGYFGASTGAGAALEAAAQEGDKIAAVVSRGGRPDLASTYLPNVKSPALLIVGGLDDVVIELNKQAYELLPEPKKLVIVPGATHLFEEPGTLEEVARLAQEWFATYLAKASTQAA